MIPKPFGSMTRLIFHSAGGAGILIGSPGGLFQVVPGPWSTHWIAGLRMTYRSNWKWLPVSRHNSVLGLVHMDVQLTISHGLTTHSLGNAALPTVSQLHHTCFYELATKNGTVTIEKRCFFTGITPIKNDQNMGLFQLFLAQQSQMVKTHELILVLL